MKKIIVIAILAMVAGMGYADQVLWSEDFTGVTIVNDADVIYYPADYSLGQWGGQTAGTSIENLPANGPRLVISALAAGGSRGAIVNVDSSVATYGNSFEYSLNFEIDAMYAKAVLDVEIWQTSSSVGNSFYADLRTPLGTENFLGRGAASSATAIRLQQYKYVDGAEGLQSIQFGWDGVHDIALLFSVNHDGSSTVDQIVKLDDINITHPIPEPATVGMLGLGALVTLLVRRFKHV